MQNCKLWPFLFLLAVLSVTSCSSVMNGTTQKVTITSNINGADVVINGNNVGRTPVTTRIRREKKVHILVKKEGYRDYNAGMETKLDPWFWGNVIIGGVLGSTTDSMMGSTHLIEPDHIHIQMDEENASKLKEGKTSNNSQEKMPKVEEYSILSFQNLIKDINRGQGDHIEALYSLKKIEEIHDRKIFLTYLKLITSEKVSAIVFARKVEEYSHRI